MNTFLKRIQASKQSFFERRISVSASTKKPLNLLASTSFHSLTASLGKNVRYDKCREDRIEISIPGISKQTVLSTLSKLEKAVNAANWYSVEASMEDDGRTAKFILVREA